MSTPLERSVRVRCSVNKAFALFTSQLDNWWPKSHRRFENSTLYLEAKVGGRFLERSATGEEALLGEVLLYDPPNRFRYTWYPGAINKPTQVDVRFSAQGKLTLVEVTHTEAESALGDVWPQRLKVFTKAWDEVLPSFASFAGSFQDRSNESS